MSKSKRYFLAVFLLSFGAVTGGWCLTKTMLGWKQQEFLDRTGSVTLQSLGSGFFSADWPGDAAGEETEETLPEREPLSEDMMAKVLAAWESGGNELLREPEKGQIHMEQAIDAGREWITAMAKYGAVPRQLAGCDFDKITARLCTLETQADFDKNLLSYWAVQFTENETVISLTVHAAWGEVWKAEILMKECEYTLQKFRSEELLKTAFPFIQRGSRETADLVNNTFCEIMPQELVYAAVKEKKIAVDEQEPVIVLDLWLGAV